MGGSRNGSKVVFPRAIVRVGLLLACLLLCSPATALAGSTYDIRGEWTFTVKTPSQEGSCTTVIREVNANGEFSSSGQCSGGLSGVLSGTIEGTEASLKAESQTPQGLAIFTSSTGAIESEGRAMSATGTFTVGSKQEQGTLKGTRLKTLKEVQEREAREQKEREERERIAREKAQKEKEEAEKAKREKEEREAAERPAREQREREAAEKVAREKQEREAAEKLAREKQEQEARERQEREARERSAAEAGKGPAGPLLAASPVAGSFTPSSVSLTLANANGFSVSGRFALKLTAATGAGRKRTAGKAVALGEASFSISPAGRVVVQVKLTRSARAALARRKSVPVKVTVTTQGSGQAPVTKAYSLTLRASARAGRKA